MTRGTAADAGVDQPCRPPCVPLPHGGRLPAGSPSMTLHLGKGRSLTAALVTSLVLSLTLALAVLVLPAGTPPGAGGHAAHRQPGHRPADRRLADRPRLRRRAADGHEHRRTLRLPQRLRARHRRLGVADQHLVDALRPDPLGLPGAVGPEDEPVPHGQADRRHRRAVGVLLPPGHDEHVRLRARRRRHADRPAADRRHEPVGLHLLRPRDRQDRLRAAHLAARHHRQPHEAVVRRRVDRAQGHRPGPQQHRQRHRALHRPLDREVQQRRQRRQLEPGARAGPSPAAASPPAPDRAPTCTTCAPRTSPSTAPAATRTSTTAAPPSRAAPTAGPTPTPSSRATRSRATWRGCSSTWRCATRATTASRTSR